VVEKTSATKYKITRKNSSNVVVMVLTNKQAGYSYTYDDLQVIL
jgi:hypothetical protein